MIWEADEVINEEKAEIRRNKEKKKRQVPLVHVRISFSPRLESAHTAEAWAEEERGQAEPTC